jgi:hypothetical protein
MKNYILFIITFFSCYFSAQSKDLSGNWREVSRKSQSGEAINFTDTIKIAFLEGNEYTWQKKRDFIYRGTYKVKNNTLDMGARIYTIEKSTAKKLILSDKYAVYEFETYTPTIGQLPAEKSPVVVNNIAAIEGTWEVFKRTSTTTMKDIDYTTLLQKMVVFSKAAEDGSWGYITASRAPMQKDGWKIMSLSDHTIHCSGKTQRSFDVTKRDGELILTEGNITYFMKRFKE